MIYQVRDPLKGLVLSHNKSNMMLTISALGLQLLTLWKAIWVSGDTAPSCTFCGVSGVAEIGRSDEAGRWQLIRGWMFRFRFRFLDVAGRATNFYEASDAWLSS